MRIRLIPLLLLLACLPARQSAAQNESTRTPWVKKFEKRFSFYPGGKVEIHAEAPGSLRISGWQNAEVLVEVEKVVYYLSPEKAEELSSRCPVRISWDRTVARIQTPASPDVSSTVEINLRIRVPRDRTDLDIHALKGDLALAGLSGWVEATLEEGGIEARDLNGYFSGITKIGDLVAEMSGGRWTGYGFSAATRRGSAELRLPEQYSAALQLETRKGTLSVDYPDQLVDNVLTPFQVESKKGGAAMSGVVGEGGAAVRLKTDAGNVHLAIAP